MLSAWEANKAALSLAASASINLPFTKPVVASIESLFAGLAPSKAVLMVAGGEGSHDSRMSPIAPTFPLTPLERRLEEQRQVNNDSVTRFEP